MILIYNQILATKSQRNVWRFGKESLYVIRVLSTIHYSITTTTVYFHHNHGRFCHICICSFCNWGRNFLIQLVFTVTNRKFPRKADSSCRASLKIRQIWNNFGPLKTTYPKIISQIYVLKKIFNYSKDGLKRVWSTYVASWEFGVNW